MVSLRRRRLILGLEPGKDNPLPLYRENIPPPGRTRKVEPKAEHESSDSEDGYIPNDRISSSGGEGCRLGHHGSSGQNRDQGERGKMTVPICMQSPASSSTSRQNQEGNTGAEQSLPDVNVKTVEKKDEKFVDTPSAVVCDNFTVITKNLPPKFLGSWSV